VFKPEPILSLIVPAYNEAKRISSTLQDLVLLDDHRRPGQVEMIVIMDGCTDRTPEIVEKILKDFRQAVILTFPNRLGKGGAIIEALKHAKGDIIAFIDADGSIPTTELLRLSKLLDHYDMVIGSRYLDGSKASVRPVKRVLFSRAFNLLVKSLFWNLRTIDDTQCGIKVFKREVLERIKYELIIADFAFDVNLLCSALKNGYRVKEVGIIWTEKNGSQLSKRFGKLTIVMGFSLLRLRIYYSPFKKILSKGIFAKVTSIMYYWSLS
jgi:glycosyltransferase involved in cell wall biosynthesis